MNVTYNLHRVQKERSSNMLVKIAPMGAESREFSLGEGATVSDLCEASDIQPEGRDIRVNSGPGTMTSVLRDRDVVTMVAKVEGGTTC